MLNFLGFSAQVCLFLSIAAIVISCISSAQASSVDLSADRIPCAEVITAPSIPHPVVTSDDELYVIDDSNDDATQFARYSCLSMDSPVYVTTIDEPTVSPDDLSCLTNRQLKALCKQRGIKRYSNLRKHELIALLQH